MSIYNSHKIYSDYYQMIDNIHLFLFEKGLIKDEQEIKGLEIDWNLNNSWVIAKFEYGEPIKFDADEFNRYVNNGFSLKPDEPHTIEHFLKTVFVKQYPDKFYTENLRYVLDTTTTAAEGIIRAAIEQGWIKQGIEFIAADNSVVYSVMDGGEVPETVVVHLEEDGDYVPYEVLTSTLGKRWFYKINK